MKRFNNINELDQRIENIIKRTVKFYYTDWKNYDRPYYMQLKGSTRKQDKKILLIARESGTYLYTLEQLKTYEFAAVVYEHYYTQVSDSKYYIIDLDRLSIEKIDPEARKRELLKAA